MKYVALAALLIATVTSASAQPKKNAPTLLRGCEVLAGIATKTTPEDAIHAAYCLGLMDGALNQYYLTKSAPPGIPQLCPPEVTPEPPAIAAQMVQAIKSRGLEKTESYGRGTSGALALSFSYTCR